MRKKHGLRRQTGAPTGDFSWSFVDGVLALYFASMKKGRLNEVADNKSDHLEMRFMEEEISLKSEDPNE